MLEQTQAPARQCSCIGLPRPRLTGRNLWSAECVKGNVLVIQKDESDSNLAAKDAKMNVDDPEDRIRCRFEFDPTVEDIAKWIDEVEARYGMDGFGGLFAGGADWWTPMLVTTSMS